MLDIHQIFDIDRLPVWFTLSPTGVYDRDFAQKAIQALVDIIWEQGGFRFWRRTVRQNRQSISYLYACSQDLDRTPATVQGGKRDRSSMDRFHCQSHLALKLCNESKTLILHLAHRYHAPYTSHHLSLEVLEYVQSKIAISTSSELFQDLKVARPRGWEHATSQQVYYRWQQANSALWRTDPDPLISATTLLRDHPLCTYLRCESHNVRGLAFYITDAVHHLAESTKEVALDATFGTSNNAMSLYAVLAELDGSGIPLAYCFTEVHENNVHGARKATPGSTTAVLDQFLSPLRDRGLNPTFVGTDKDFAEIRAVQQVWPAAKVQLCYWHARRAMRSRLANSRHAQAAVTQYRPSEAATLVADIEICWASIPTSRPNGLHRYAQCECVSRNFDITASTYRESVTADDQVTMLDIFSKHYNAHTFIPGVDGAHHTPKAIHQLCVTEAYHWSRSHNYPKLWAYLWANWYKPDHWSLWARSVDAIGIPVLKTTMIVESHWRKVKHDYLHRFCRPRVDLTIWILLTRAIPNATTRMHALLRRDHRQATASWRKDFKVEWDNLTGRALMLDAGSPARHHTEAAKWTCGCPYFLMSRFLICKHIIACFAPILDRVNFFRNVTRHREPPFWRHGQLTLLLAYEARPHVDVNDPELAEFRDETDNASDCDALHEDQLVELNTDESMVNLDDFVSNMGALMKVFEEQRAIGNNAFLQRFITANKSNLQLLQEVVSIRARRTRPNTWGARKHPATMYYQH